MSHCELLYVFAFLHFIAVCLSTICSEKSILEGQYRGTIVQKWLRGAEDRGGVCHVRFMKTHVRADDCQQEHQQHQTVTQVQQSLI